MKSHGLDLKLEYSVENKKVVKSNNSLLGFIELGTGKTKVVVPMRSFVRSFLDIIHSHFKKTATYSVLKTAIAPASNTGYGVQIGLSESAVSPLDTSISLCDNADMLNGVNTMTSPVIVDTKSKFTITRDFTNQDVINPYEISELGVSVKNTNTASAKSLLIRDISVWEVPAGDTMNILYSIEANHDSSTGGLLLNAIKFIYNVIFNGNVTASSMIKTNGTNFASTYATGADATTASYFAVLSSISDNFGIVVGYDTKATSPNSTNMTMVTTNITKSITDISDIAINGSETSFTITRDFTNTGSSNITLNRIGILTKSLIYLAINNTGSDIVLQPNQKLRVTYTLSTTC